MRSALLFLLVASVLFAAERPSPIKWSMSLEPATAAPGGQLLAKFTATPDGGYHLYSLTTPKGGPIRTTISLAEQAAVKKVQVFQPAPNRKFDPNFQLDTETFEGTSTFLLLVTLADDAPIGPLELTANARYQACNDKLCLPPVKRSATAPGTVAAGAPRSAPAIPAGYTEVKAEGAESAGVSKAAPPAGPVKSAAEPDRSLGQFLLVAFGFGLAAIFTPCVFPMIPITVSVFLEQQTGKRSDGVKQALLFCLGIVVLFTSMGLVIKAVAGPAGVVKLGASPWVNGLIALVFLVFGLSMLGAFELTLPSSLLTKLDAGSRRGGVVGTLLMGLTFSLASFACVGPFVGTLLAASVKESGGLQPILGMAAFASGLALPFFFLALFPGVLSKLPRNGAWMSRVKIVMGFVILAAMLKYLSNVDQVLQWNLLTRERFLAAWIILFALPGLYLLGLLRLEGVKRDEQMGVGRLLTAALFLIFSISLAPGLFGARLGELDAYVPPPGTNFSSGLAANPSGKAQSWRKNQLDAALAEAKQSGKTVLVVFTGVTCTNCHWMRANMFPRPAVAAAVKDMILVELYTDGDSEQDKRNQEFEEKQFSTVAIPLYALLDGTGKVLGSFAGATRDEREFLAFLQPSAPA